MSDLSVFLNLAQNIAENAVQVLEENINKYQRVEQEFARDVRVLADRRLESVIIRRLLEESSYPLLAEEAGFLEGSNKNTDYCWIIDPLDGSFNFSRDIPINCISISLWKGMNPLLGVIHDFNRDEIFSGLVGGGAWLNGNPITISKITEKSNAVLCTGFPVSTNFSEKSLHNFIENIKEYKKIRLLGSAALSLAYVACGRTDVYLENDIKIWDVAAGIAIVKAAGGVAEYTPTDRENIFRVKASNPYL